MIEQYKPQRDISPEWPLVRDFVVGCVMCHAPETIRDIRTHLGYLARFAVWLRREGIPLEADDAFDINVIDFYLRDDLVRRGRTEYHAYRVGLALRDYREHLTGEHAVLRTVSSAVSAPYTPRELRAFLADADSQPTETARRDLTAALALGAGAGLLTHEMFELRVGDVHRADHGYTIFVNGTKPRAVPMRRDWCAPFEGVLAGRGTDEYVGWTNRARTGKRLGRGLLKPLGASAPAPNRLRTTWILEILRLDLPLPVTLELTRLESLQGLTPYFDFLPKKRHWTSNYASQIAGVEESR